MFSYTNYFEFREKLDSFSLSVSDVLEHYLAEIENKNQLNLVIEVFEEARERAKHIDEKIRNKTAGKLAGMVIGIKDNIFFKDHLCTAASETLQGFNAPYTSEVVDRLIAEDALIIARLNCDEFAMGSSNEWSYYGSATNPHDASYVCGGSSGGSAGAVAAGLCMVSLGTDTGGSIRQPASYCGVFGFKPTLGAISNHGVIPYADSFDQLGVLTSNSADLELISDILFEKELVSEVDLDTDQIPTLCFNVEHSDGSGIDPVIKKFFNTSIEKLRSKFRIESFNSDWDDLLLPVYQVLTTYEASQNFEKIPGELYLPEKAFDAIKFRSENFGHELKRKIFTGNYVKEYGPEFDLRSKALDLREEIKSDYQKLLQKGNLIISPTTPTTAFRKGLKQNVEQTIAQDLLCLPANLGGFPAVTLPLGISNGLPFGIQIMGNALSDKHLLEWAQKIYDFLSPDIQYDGF